MTSRWASVVTIALLFSNPLIAAEVPVNGKPTPTQAPTSDAVAKLARSSNAFGFDLYQRLRPFLFLIRDNASGLVLFLGRVSDPG
jgi:serine protease inhibitor